MIDFHCHLDLYDDPHKVAEECKRRGVYALSVTTTPSAWRGTVQLADDAPRIRTALGLHPQLVHERKGEFPLFEQFLPEARYVGEIGLDGGPECRSFWDDQTKIFERILAACEAAGGRVFSVHSRRATTAVLDAIQQKPNAGTPVLHWFSGTVKELDRASSLGCWFSVGPAMLHSAKGRTLASRMPRNRILTETDGPFARAPDSSPLYPWDAEMALLPLSDIWGVEVEEARLTIQQNLSNLVRALT